MRCKSADFVSVKVENVHDAPMRSERQELVMHSQATRSIRLEELDDVHSEPLVLELWLLPN